MLGFITSHSELFANIFGFSAMFTAIITYQFKKHRTIMLLIILCSALWCFHYACLGLWTPIAMNGLNIVKNTVYCFRDKKWAQSPAIPGIFIVISLVTTILTWQNYLSILPFIAAVFAAVGQWQTDTKKLKILSIPVSGCWLVYNIINRSWAGMCNEIFVLISILTALLRLKKEESKTELK